WRTLMTKAGADHTPAVRRAAAAILGRFGSNAVVELVGPMLADSDRDVRRLASVSVLELLSGVRVAADATEALELALGDGIGSVDAPSRNAKTNQPLVTPKRLQAW